MKKKKGKRKLIVVLSIIAFVIIAILIAGIVILRVNTAPRKQEGEASDATIAKTQNGLLQGRLNDGVYNFLGVKYATADELFKPAKPVENWEGVKMAFEYGACSPQQVLLGGLGEAISGVKYDNDCQNLNIWTNGLDESGKRPVMVWLHGGGFSTGSSYSSASYNGEKLAKTQDVVVVGVNHRLNLLGHLDLSEYGEDYRYSANVGVDDIVKALTWIRDNISAFGGDPDNVTLFGQSGGGAKILALMTTPYAKGLFHKAIIQSGATETVGVSFTSKEVSKRVTSAFLKQLNIDKENISSLKDIPYSKLNSAGTVALSVAAEEFKIPGPFGGYSTEWEPVVDGDYIPVNPVTEDGFADNGKDIPLLIGSNLTEWTRFVSSERLTVTDDVKKAFSEAYPNENVNDAEFADTLIRLPILKIALHKAKQNGAKVYNYLYTYESAYHGAETPYVFANSDGVMNDLMPQIWANFAKYGVPSAKSLPTWKAFDEDTKACMILDEKSYLAKGHDSALLKLVAPDYVF